mgnify:CR=1 FL=1
MIKILLTYPDTAMGAVDPVRLQPLNDSARRETGRYVLYWMQQSQRAIHNPALEYALERANDAGQPLLVVFGLMDDYPEANLRHYTFMLEGLKETQAALAERGVQMVVRHGRPNEVALTYAEDASLLVTDRGYLRHQKQWRAHVAEAGPGWGVPGEGGGVVAVGTVTDKAEYAGRANCPQNH